MRGTCPTSRIAMWWGGVGVCTLYCTVNLHVVVLTVCKAQYGEWETHTLCVTRDHFYLDGTSWLHVLGPRPGAGPGGAYSFEGVTAPGPRPAAPLPPTPQPARSGSAQQPGRSRRGVQGSGSSARAAKAIACLLYADDALWIAFHILSHVMRHSHIQDSSHTSHGHNNLHNCNSLVVVVRRRRRTRKS